MNGAKSKGPKVPNVAANAITHGITAKTLILQNENAEEFLAMWQSYLDELKPATQIESDLISDLVAARWRLRRLRRYETAMLDIEMDAQAEAFEKRFVKHDEDMRGSLAFDACIETRPGFRPALRYEAHLNRLYRRTLQELREVTKQTREPSQ